MDRAAIIADLDCCLLTDEELAGGPSEWTRMSDPLPTWDVHAHAA